MNTFKNTVVAFSFLGCTIILTAIVSLATVNTNTNTDLLTNAKSTKTVTATSTEIQNIK